MQKLSSQQQQLLQVKRDTKPPADLRSEQTYRDHSSEGQNMHNIIATLSPTANVEQNVHWLEQGPGVLA